MKRERLAVEFFQGFTLVEIIVTLLLIGMTAALIFPVMGTNLMKSPEPIVRLGNQYRIVEAMDELTAAYRDEIAAKGFDFSITGFKTSFVDPVISNPAASNLDGAGAQYLEDGDRDGAYEVSAGTTPILMVTFQKGGQMLHSIFSE